MQYFIMIDIYNCLQDSFKVVPKARVVTLVVHAGKKYLNFLSLFSSDIESKPLSTYKLIENSTSLRLWISHNLSL